MAPKPKSPIEKESAAKFTEVYEIEAAFGRLIDSLIAAHTARGT